MKRARAFFAWGLFCGALLLGGCGGGEPEVPSPAGAYALDKFDYALGLWRGEDAGRLGQRPAGDDKAWIEARRIAQTVSLSLDLREAGSFVVRYRFGKEQGARRGAWSLEGDRLDLRITHDAAGPVKRGAAVSARRTDEGLRFEGWPVPNAFLLRPE